MHAANEQSRFRAVVDTAVDGVILINADGVILMFNPACERLFGYATFEVVGRNVKMLMPEPYRGEHDNYLENYRETGERKIIGIGREVMGRKRSGATFPMDLSVGEASEDGQPIFVGIIRDLTRRKATEQSARENAARLQALIETAADGVMLIDARGLILIFNPACERLFGYTQREVIGRNVKMLMPEPYKSEHDNYLTNYRETGERKIIGASREVVGLRKDASTFPMDISVGEAKQEGAASFFVGVIHDLTERKRTEEQLVQAQKMEIVGQLSGGIAHDFNNLLTVILGNAEALSMRLRQREDLHHLAEAIAASAERGAELTQRLLAFSRRQVLQPAAVDCTALVESMQIMLRRMLRDDIEVEIAAPAAPVHALADPAQLESALLNLSLNAQDAMPNGGQLLFTTGEIELDAVSLGPGIEVKPGPHAMLSVTDTGTGMTREVRERVFEPFFTTKEVGKGSGLGLSMVYGFARQSNGYVSIYSEVAIGTSVRIFLPLAEAGAALAVQPRDASEKMPGGGETILIVEDDPYVRNHGVTSLETLGYRVIVAADGREAITALHAGARPALLFTDVVMPGGVTGLELVAQARALAPDLRVLFTSGYPREVLTGRGQLDANAELLSKPYRIAELARRVREILDREER